MRSLVVVMVLSLSVIAPPLTPTASAQPADARAKKLLDAGERFFADLEYGKAIKVLLPVARDPAASRARRVRAWELIALSRFILGDRGGARTAFERVLDADPGFQLRDDSGSPRIREFFDEVRADVLGAATSAVDLEHERGATDGRARWADRGRHRLAVGRRHRRRSVGIIDPTVISPAGDDEGRQGGQPETCAHKMVRAAGARSCSRLSRA